MAQAPTFRQVIQRVFISATNSLRVTLAAGTVVIGHIILDAGTAIIGKVGIDQTTPGTTNGVVINSSPILGEVQASPTSNTVLDRLKALLTGIVIAAGTNLIGKVSEPATVETPFTGTGNLEVATSKITPGAVFKLTEIVLHLNAAPTTSTQNLVISVDDGVGGAYDENILTIDLVANAITDLVIKPNKVCKATDVITAAWTNTDTKTYGLKFKHQLL